MVLLQTGHGDGSISQMSDCQRRHFPNFKILQSESQWTLAHAVVIEYDQVITCYPFNGVIIEKSDFWYFPAKLCQISMHCKWSTGFRSITNLATATKVGQLCPTIIALARWIFWGASNQFAKKKLGKTRTGGSMQKRSKRNEQNRTHSFISNKEGFVLCWICVRCSELHVYFLAILSGCLKYCLVKCCMMIINEFNLHNFRRCNFFFFVNIYYDDKWQDLIAANSIEQCYKNTTTQYLSLRVKGSSCNQCQGGFGGFDIKLALVHFVFPIRRKWV